MQALRTTHTGSMPRPKDLADLVVAKDRGEAAPGLDERIRTAVAEIVRRQTDIGVDLVNDGEMARVGYATYVRDRLTGFDGESEWISGSRPEMDDHPDFAVRWRAGLQAINPRFPACTSDIRVKDPDAVHRDIATLKAAAASAGIGTGRLFMTAASPGVISHFFANRHYPSRESFLEALGEAMRHDYEAIAAAGLLLQIDCPDQAMSRHSIFASLSLAEFRKAAAFNVEVLNNAVRNIPAERMRMHVCWGNYDGPHDYDVPLRDVVDVVLRAKPAGLVLEGCNPRHAHEWQVWKDVRLPDGKYLVTGVIDTTNNYVEHPELVAQRLLQLANLVGSDRVMGGSDCGFGSVVMDVPVVAPTVVWSKLSSLVKGAALASRELGLSR
jgi:5-methyltetrahydropteroyltriglutamate--homocysteine methyltransferase